MKPLLVFALAALAVRAQQPQNPSPMVEHTRAHLRVVGQSRPQGRREKLDVGTLFLPAGLKKGAPILFFFHGDTWIPEVAAARNGTAAVSVQVGTGSAVYARLFEDPQRFLKLLGEAESKAGMK